MTAEEEANMWARLVKLEEQVGHLIDLAIKLAGQRYAPEELPSRPTEPPPRDRYGTAGT